MGWLLNSILGVGTSIFNNYYAENNNQTQLTRWQTMKNWLFASGSGLARHIIRMIVSRNETDSLLQVVNNYMRHSHRTTNANRGTRERNAHNLANSSRPNFRRRTHRRRPIYVDMRYATINLATNEN